MKQRKDNPFLAIIIITLITATFVVGSADALTYTSQYPPSQSITYVNSTTKASTDYYPYFMTDPTKALTGTPIGNSWASLAGAKQQRIHIDLGSVKSITRIYYENFHYAGADEQEGVSNFTFWGSNISSAFAPGTATLAYANDTGWTAITTPVTDFEKHAQSNTTDPKYMVLASTATYRYFAFKMHDQWGTWYGMFGMRRIELQSTDPVSSFTPVASDGAALLPVTFTDTSTSTVDPITGWNWTIRGVAVTGHGTNTTAYPAASTAQNASFTFTPGNFTVSLNVSTAISSNVSTQISWVNVSNDITQYNFTVGAHTIVVFNGSGGMTTWTPPAGVTGVDYLVVGGGGGGSGRYYGGGGGAGGFRANATGTPFAVSGAVTVIVGKGGTGHLAANGTNGGNSVFDTIVAVGGGGGGWVVGSNGGSGGGAGKGVAGSSEGIPGIADPVGQGNDGGDDAGSGAGGGGGGAGSVGAIGVGNTGGNGGAGLLSSINGTSSGYAGGGGGDGGAAAGTATDGGGAGGIDSGAQSGVPNTGGGGGGCRDNVVGDGGSGIVIIKYLTTGTDIPSASFTTIPSPSIGVDPLAVAFTDTSTNIPVSWNWTIQGYGTNSTKYLNASTSQNPSFTFTVGNYSISLGAGNAFGHNISAQETWVNVSSGVTIPAVQFTVNKNTVVFPGRVYFNDTSLNVPTQWNWSFGDGTWYNTTTPGLGLNVSHQYTKRGVWASNLTVGNSAGTNTSAAMSKNIRVIGYQGFELPPNPTIWDWIDAFFTWLENWWYCVLTNCDPPQPIMSASSVIEDQPLVVGTGFARPQ
jgi:PKD repeat protein